MERKTVDIRLIESAIGHFGRVGLDGASTRAIARDADTLMSSITYHFGGKEGLYLAAADHIAARMGQYLAQTLADVAAMLDADPGPGTARRALQAIAAAIADIMLRDEMAAFASFIVREQAAPTDAFDRIYENVMGRVLAQVGALLQRIAGDRMSQQEARLRAISLVGQVLVFRVGRATLLRSTGWTDIGIDESAAIKAVIASNLDAIFDHMEAGGRA